jgi:hypothetical protein
LLIEGRAGSVGELLDEAKRIRRAFKPDDDDREEIWYRGERKASNSLVPTLYRSHAKRFHYDELSLMDRFGALAAPLVARPGAGIWEWYFLARHHMLPSRLLDWSESLLAAAYFAIEGEYPADRLELDAQCRDKWRKAARPKTEWPVVWVLDAGTLNLHSLGKNGIVTLPGKTSDSYLPERLRKNSGKNAKPIALYPPRTNMRIAAQHGTFTLHGHEREPLEKLASKSAKIKMWRILIDLAKVPKLCEELNEMGMHVLSIYQDLDSVARHVCWTMQSKKP